MFESSRQIRPMDNDGIGKNRCICAGERGKAGGAFVKLPILYARYQAEFVAVAGIMATIVDAKHVPILSSYLLLECCKFLEESPSSEDDC